MEKRTNNILYTLMLILVFSGCVANKYYSNCPTNDPKYFFKQQGYKAQKTVKPLYKKTNDL